MVKRTFDILSSCLGLILCAPLLLIAAIGIKLSTPGPVLYRAARVGLNRKPFTMHKLRTMHVADETPGCVITGPNDPRVFAFGKFLRKTKIDELPQIYDVLRGKMSIVGPRPEAADIVDKHYTNAMLSTLDVKPGLTSPGTLFYYLHSHHYMSEGGDAYNDYVEHLLDRKMAFEIDYMQNASFTRDLKVILDTFLAIASVILRNRRKPSA